MKMTCLLLEQVVSVVQVNNMLKKFYGKVMYTFHRTFLTYY
ncbi:MAG: hypothetical protein H6Q69_354 [Firmicutes bacterium]|nr:hypothetical protein [Bacillota bacterium]